MPPASFCGATSSSRADDRSAWWEGDPVTLQEILQRLDALGVAAPLAIDAGAPAGPCWVRPNLRRGAPHLSKIAPSSLQRAASCSSVCCAWTRESGAAARDAGSIVRANRILAVSHWWRSSPRHYTGPSLRGSVAETSGDRMKGERMISRSMVRRALGLCIAGAATACANASSTLGNDPSSRTTASAVTWSDGKPAISISCEQPGGCQTRAVAMCKGPNYTVLNMENMPTRGDMTMVRGAASIVIRCA